MGMAQHSQEGTGKHPHKSAEEPYPHNEAPTTKGHSNESHPKSETHKSESHSGGSKTQHASDSGNSGSESSDLKSREYTDKDGNVHHHTHTAGKSK